jgi:hypothetical protein
MRKLAVLSLLAIVAVASIGCVGDNYTLRKDYHDLTVIQGGRTGVFGTDNSWWYVQEKQAPQPDIYRLQETYSRTAEITDQGCPDPAQTKNIRREKIKEVRTRDVPNPNKRAPVVYGGGGTNPSTGNVAVPAALNGTAAAATGGTFYYLGQKARRPAQIGINQQQQGGGGGGATVGDVTAKTGPIKNINDNTNINPTNIKIKNTAEADAWSKSGSKAVICDP